MTFYEMSNGGGGTSLVGISAVGGAPATGVHPKIWKASAIMRGWHWPSSNWVANPVSQVLAWIESQVLDGLRCPIRLPTPLRKLVTLELRRDRQERLGGGLERGRVAGSEHLSPPLDPVHQAGENPTRPEFHKGLVAGGEQPLHRL